jgi:hypothetical protein
MAEGLKDKVMRSLEEAIGGINPGVQTRQAYEYFYVLGSEGPTGRVLAGNRGLKAIIIAEVFQNLYVHRQKLWIE